MYDGAADDAASVRDTFVYQLQTANFAVIILEFVICNYQHPTGIIRNYESHMRTKFGAIISFFISLSERDH